MAEPPFNPETGLHRRWAAIVAQAEPDIDLAEAALEIAAPEYPGLDVAAYLRAIAGMAAQLKRRLRPDIATAEALLALNHYLFDELGFAGNAADYYDPRNSFLNEVLDRRLGIPITLSIVFLEIGQRLGLALRGVSFPGHFLVRCPVREGAIVIDPYAGGVSLGMDDLLRRLRAAGAPGATEADLRRLLAPAGKRDILARMLRNLKAVYQEREEPARALSASSRLILLDPDAAEEYRDRGALYHQLECFRSALSDYRRYLQLRPRASDAPAVLERIAALEPLAASLN